MRLLSPRELADAIGVSESSLKRWADAGRIKVTRTEGGHRRIPLAEALRFIRNQRLPLVRPDLLGVAAKRDGDGDDDALHDHLTNGQAAAARAWVMGRYLAGATAASLCDGPIRAAMTRIGELWKHDPAGIFVEHRATDICIQALAALRAVFEPPAPEPVALGGGPAGDPYLLPSWMAATVIAEAGVTAINLGPDTPVSAFRTAVARHRPALVWVSSTAAVPLAVAAEVADWLASLPRGVAGVAGGQNVAALVAANDTITTAATMAELAACARAAARAGSADTRAPGRGRSRPRRRTS